MHDVNPLGPMMHLGELDRRAARQLRPFRPEGDGTPKVAVFAATIVAFLRCIHAVVRLGKEPGTQQGRTIR